MHLLLVHTDRHRYTCVHAHKYTAHINTHTAIPRVRGLQQASAPQQHLYKYKHMHCTQCKPRRAQRKSSAIAWICLAGFGKVYYSAGCLVKRIVHNQFPLHYSAVVALQAVAIYAVILLGGFFFSHVSIVGTVVKSLPSCQEMDSLLVPQTVSLRLVIKRQELGHPMPVQESIP